MLVSRESIFTVYPRVTLYNLFELFQCASDCFDDKSEIYSRENAHDCYFISLVLSCTVLIGHWDVYFEFDGENRIRCYLLTKLKALLVIVEQNHSLPQIGLSYVRIREKLIENCIQFKNTQSVCDM